MTTCHRFNNDLTLLHYVIRDCTFLICLNYIMSFFYLKFKLCSYLCIVFPAYNFITKVSAYIVFINLHFDCFIKRYYIFVLICISFLLTDLEFCSFKNNDSLQMNSQMPITSFCCSTAINKHYNNTSYNKIISPK